MAGEANTTVYEAVDVSQRERQLRDTLGTLGRVLADVELSLDFGEIGDIERTRLAKTLGNIATYADHISELLGGTKEGVAHTEPVTVPVVAPAETGPSSNGNGHAKGNGHSNGNGSRNGAKSSAKAASSNGHKEVTDQADKAPAAKDAVVEAPKVEQAQASEPAKAEPVKKPSLPAKPPVNAEKPLTARQLGMDPERYDQFKNFMLEHVGEPMRVADILNALPASMTLGARKQAFKKFRALLVQEPGFAGRLVDHGNTGNRTYTLLPDGESVDTPREDSSVQAETKDITSAEATPETSAQTKQATQSEAPAQTPAKPQAETIAEPEVTCLAETKWGAKILEGADKEPYLVFNGQTIKMRTETTRLFVKLLTGGSKLYNDMLNELLVDDPEMTKPLLNGMIHELENFFEQYADKDLFQLKLINTPEGRQRILSIAKEGPDFLARAQQTRAQ